MCSSDLIIDLIAILPGLVGAFVALDLRYMRLFRLLRLLKLTHYFRGLEIFISVAQAQARKEESVRGHGDSQHREQPTPGRPEFRALAVSRAEDDGIP